MAAATSSPAGGAAAASSLQSYPNNPPAGAATSSPNALVAGRIAAAAAPLTTVSTPTPITTNAPTAGSMPVAANSNALVSASPAAPTPAPPAEAAAAPATSPSVVVPPPIAPAPPVAAPSFAVPKGHEDDEVGFLASRGGGVLTDRANPLFVDRAVSALNAAEVANNSRALVNQMFAQDDASWRRPAETLSLSHLSPSVSTWIADKAPDFGLRAIQSDGGATRLMLDRGALPSEAEVAKSLGILGHSDVADYQGSKGYLKTDGVVGPRTSAAMLADLGNSRLLGGPGEDVVDPTAGLVPSSDVGGNGAKMTGMNLGGKSRSLPPPTSLVDKAAKVIGDVYGPGYTFVIQSGMSPAARGSGVRGTSSGRHSTVNNPAGAMDIQIFDPQGRQLAGDALTKFGTKWVGSGLGSVGINLLPTGDPHAASPGETYTHVDGQVLANHPGQGNFWAYKGDGSGGHSSYMPASMRTAFINAGNSVPGEDAPDPFGAVGFQASRAAPLVASADVPLPNMRPAYAPNALVTPATSAVAGEAAMGSTAVPRDFSAADMAPGPSGTVTPDDIRLGDSALALGDAPGVPSPHLRPDNGFGAPAQPVYNALGGANPGDPNKWAAIQAAFTAAHAHQALPAAKDEGVSVLATGSKGHTVGMYQTMLAGLGYYKGRLDNDFGGKTDAAVRQFQRDWNAAHPDIPGQPSRQIKVDGKLGMGPGAETGPAIAAAWQEKVMRPATASTYIAGTEIPSRIAAATDETGFTGVARGAPSPAPPVTATPPSGTGVAAMDALRAAAQEATGKSADPRVSYTPYEYDPNGRGMALPALGHDTSMRPKPAALPGLTIDPNIAASPASVGTKNIAASVRGYTPIPPNQTLRDPMASGMAPVGSENAPAAAGLTPDRPPVRDIAAAARGYTPIPPNQTPVPRTVAPLDLGAAAAPATAAAPPNAFDSPADFAQALVRGAGDVAGNVAAGAANVFGEGGALMTASDKIRQWLGVEATAGDKPISMKPDGRGGWQLFIQSPGTVGGGGGGDNRRGTPISSNLMRIRNDADYASLPPGTVFIDPEGHRRQKVA